MYFMTQRVEVMPRGEVTEKGASMMWVKQFFKTLFCLELIRSKLFLSVICLTLLAYSAEMIALLAVTRQLRQEAHLVRETQLLKVTEQPAAMYKDYLDRFGKNYDPVEEVERFSIFKESLKEIAYLNRVTGARHGLTKFSDVSKDDIFPKTPRLYFQNVYNEPQKVNKFCMDEMAREIFSYDLSNDTNLDKELPPSFDWRNEVDVVGPVVYETCNGCSAFAIVGVMESMAAIRHLDHGVRRSIQEVMDYSGSYIGGNVERSLDWLCDNRWGVLTAIEYYMEQLGTPTLRLRNPQGRRVKQYWQFRNIDEHDILRYVAFHGPAIAVVNARSWMNYRDGVIQRACRRDTNAPFKDHVVQIVGYDLTGEVPHYIIRNSWGKNFGEGGYVKLAIGGNVCGVADEITLLDVY